MNCQLNNEKVWSIKGKTTKSSITFRINKPNFQNAQMNVNAFLQKDYENETAFRPKKQTQNKPNLRKSKMSLKSLRTVDGFENFSYCTKSKWC